jgi:hypothetical protein
MSVVTQALTAIRSYRRTMTWQQTEQTQGPLTQAPSLTNQRAGTVTIAAGALGALSAAAILLTAPMVSTTRFSYPFDVSWFVVAQLLFAVQHLAMIAGVVGLYPLLAPPTRLWRAALIMAGGGFVLLIGCELFGLLAATATNDSAIAQAVSTAYGLPTVLVGVGFVLSGWVVGRRNLLPGGRWLPLAFGLYVFVVLIPALVGPDIAGRLALGGWMVLYLLLGVALVRRARA